MVCRVAARGGLQVGRGQQAAIPHGTPPALAGTLRRLISDVFGHAYITAMRPTLAISVGLLLAGGVRCLLLPRRTASAAPATPTAAAAAPTAVAKDEIAG